MVLWIASPEPTSQPASITMGPNNVIMHAALHVLRVNLLLGFIHLFCSLPLTLTLPSLTLLDADIASWLGERLALPLCVPRRRACHLCFLFNTEQGHRRMVDFAWLQLPLLCEAALKEGLAPLFQLYISSLRRAQSLPRSCPRHALFVQDCFLLCRNDARCVYYT